MRVNNLCKGKDGISTYRRWTFTRTACFVLWSCCSWILASHWRKHISVDRELGVGGCGLSGAAVVASQDLWSPKSRTLRWQAFPFPPCLFLAPSALVVLQHKCWQYFQVAALVIQLPWKAATGQRLKYNLHPFWMTLKEDLTYHCLDKSCILK